MQLMSVEIEGMLTIGQALRAFSVQDGLVLFYVSLLSTVFGYGMWGKLLSTYPVGLVTPFALLVPLFGMLASHVWLGEIFNPIKMLSAALILSGLVISCFGDRLQLFWQRFGTGIK